MNCMYAGPIPRNTLAKVEKVLSETNHNKQSALTVLSVPSAYMRYYS